MWKLSTYKKAAKEHPHMQIAFIGSGKVGAPLADQLQRLGHTVTLAASDPNSKSIQKALARNPALKVAAPPEAIRAAEVVFLATPFQAIQAVLEPVAQELRGKILIDCTNSVGPNFTHGLNGSQSGAQVIQALVPETRLVKAFNIYGSENFENNTFPNYNVKPVMMYCGQDTAAKETVGKLITQMGWQALDVGGLEQALPLEYMTLLWVRMVRANGHSPDMVWAMLTR
jgi:8-hydroxy-5-deazaflavin:NADPH oxidoreductase